MLEKAVSTSAFSGWQRVRVHALLVGRRIDLRALYRTDSLAVAPLAIPAGEHGMAVLFRYGAVVMFNLQIVEEAAFLVSLRSVVGETHDQPEREEVEIAVEPAADERVDAGGVIHLREVTAERLLVVADVLAKSVILAYDENSGRPRLRSHRTGGGGAATPRRWPPRRATVASPHRRCADHPTPHGRPCRSDGKTRAAVGPAGTRKALSPTAGRIRAARASSRSNAQARSHRADGDRQRSACCRRAAAFASNGISSS